MKLYISNIGNTDKPIPTPAEIAKQKFLSQSAIDKFSYLYDAAQQQSGDFPVERIDEISYEVSDLNTNVNDLNSYVTDLNTNVNDLNSYVTDLNTNVDNLENTVDELNTNVSDMNSSVTELSADVTSINEKLFKNVFHVNNQSDAYEIASQPENTLFYINTVVEPDDELSSVQFPNNSSVEFINGYINCDIVGNNTTIFAGLQRIFGDDCNITGTFTNSEVPIEWFGAQTGYIPNKEDLTDSEWQVVTPDKSFDNSIPIQHALNTQPFKEIYFQCGFYYVGDASYQNNIYNKTDHTGFYENYTYNNKTYKNLIIMHYPKHIRMAGKTDGGFSGNARFMDLDNNIAFTCLWTDIEANFLLINTVTHTWDASSNKNEYFKHKEAVSVVGGCIKYNVQMPSLNDVAAILFYPKGNHKSNIETTLYGTNIGSLNLINLNYMFKYYLDYNICNFDILAPQGTAKYSYSSNFRTRLEYLTSTFENWAAQENVYDLTLDEDDPTSYTYHRHVSQKTDKHPDVYVTYGFSVVMSYTDYNDNYTTYYPEYKNSANGEVNVRNLFEFKEDDPNTYYTNNNYNKIDNFVEHRIAYYSNKSELTKAEQDTLKALKNANNYFNTNNITVTQYYTVDNDICTDDIIVFSYVPYEYNGTTITPSTIGFRRMGINYWSPDIFDTTEYEGEKTRLLGDYRRIWHDIYTPYPWDMYNKCIRPDKKMLDAGYKGYGVHITHDPGRTYMSASALNSAMYMTTINSNIVKFGTSVLLDHSTNYLDITSTFLYGCLNNAFRYVVIKDRAFNGGVIAPEIQISGFNNIVEVSEPLIQGVLEHAYIDPWIWDIGNNVNIIYSTSQAKNNIRFGNRIMFILKGNSRQTGFTEVMPKLTCDRTKYSWKGSLLETDSVDKYNSWSLYKYFHNENSEIEEANIKKFISNQLGMLIGMNNDSTMSLNAFGVYQPSIQGGGNERISIQNYVHTIDNDMFGIDHTKYARTQVSILDNDEPADPTSYTINGGIFDVGGLFMNGTFFNESSPTKKIVIDIDLNGFSPNSGPYIQSLAVHLKNKTYHYFKHLRIDVEQYEATYVGSRDSYYIRKYALFDDDYASLSNGQYLQDNILSFIACTNSYLTTNYFNVHTTIRRITLTFTDYKNSGAAPNTGNIMFCVFMEGRLHRKLNKTITTTGGGTIGAPIYIDDKIHNMGTQAFENLGELNTNQSQFAVSGRAYVGHDEIATDNYVAKKNRNGKFYIEDLIVTDMTELLALNDVDDPTFIGPFSAGQKAFVEEDGEEMIFTGSEWLTITYHENI